MGLAEPEGGSAAVCWRFPGGRWAGRGKRSICFVQAAKLRSARTCVNRGAGVQRPRPGPAGADADAGAGAGAGAARNGSPAGFQLLSLLVPNPPGDTAAFKAMSASPAHMKGWNVCNILAGGAAPC